MNEAEIVNKVWNYAQVLRDDVVGYRDYVEQISYLIILKMADERDKAGQQVQVPTKFNWDHLVKLDGDDLKLQCQYNFRTGARISCFSHWHY
jgi:type I restriction enzyme M protein